MDIFTACIEQIVGAYRLMDRKGKYRPAAPSDGFGHLTTEKRADRDEAERYTQRWWQDEESRKYWIGSPANQTRVALILVVEAARLICGKLPECNVTALRLLKMAVAELQEVVTTQARRRKVFDAGVAKMLKVESAKKAARRATRAAQPS
jgi:hypothetical protein